MTLAISDASATLLGGVIAGAVVLLGVLLAEWLRRAHDRRSELEAAARIIALKTPIALGSLLPNPKDPQRLQQGSPGWNVLQEVLDAVLVVDVASRPRLTRRRAAVRESLDDVSARVGVAHIRWLKSGDLLTHAQLLSAAGATGELSRAVFGEREPFDDLWKRYESEGLPDD